MNTVRLSFSTKAGTLAQVRQHLVNASVPQMVVFRVDEWRRTSETCRAAVLRDLGDGLLIVRSSRLGEDGAAESHAGEFLSVCNVHPEALAEAVERVIASYGDAIDTDEVLVQPMLSNVVRSGVVFSHDPNTCAPYRIVSWHEGADTARVTAGHGCRTWQGAASSPVAPPPDLTGVWALVDELLALFGNVPVDCEFAVTRSEGIERLWLLQARPLVLPAEAESSSDQARRLSLIASKVAHGMRRQPFLMGNRTVYGVMPDWNPAEIIGVRPRPLALSLYRELITDAIWAYQRNNYGYRNLRSFPLMPHFFGLPYIDVRLSFNSFIPADLDEGLAGRLVDYYIERLLVEPTLHDKVEFEIVYSCYTLDLPERLERLADAGFSADDRRMVADSLRRLTNRVIHPKDGLWRADAAKLDVLNTRRATLLSSDANHLDRIYWLLEDAKRYGTLPFAGLARAGFIAVQMLRSLVSVGVFSQSDYDAFLASVTTVSTCLTRDRAILDKQAFLVRYGHLRCGTYDVMSPRYDENPDLYFDWSKVPSRPEPLKPFSLTLPQLREIVRLLDVHALHPDGVALFDFLQAGIELREFAKFEFTRNLSDILSLAVAYGERFGFSRDDLSYLDLGVLRELYVAAADPADLLAHSIELGRARYGETRHISLPPVITSPEDVWAFEWPETAPNFITQKDVTGPVVGPHDRNSLHGSIVCIASADPGFDWLFAYPIAGLVTAWGGANSHMAIRAGERGLPAVIGAGEALFRRWSSANTLHIDCAGRRVEVLN